LISSRSGTLSCTQSAPATASAMLPWKVSAPSGGNAPFIEPGSDRRALASTSPILRSASGSGSATATSQPFSRNRAAQPPPMTPPPMIAAFM
jgi:hypothetical protein